jgi:hypothetical protein
MHVETATQGLEVAWIQWQTSIGLNKTVVDHNKRVARVGDKLDGLGIFPNHFSQEELMFIRMGRLLHDVGKIQVPDSILKGGVLIREEVDYYFEQHGMLGYELLEKAFPQIPHTILLLVAGHHDETVTPIRCNQYFADSVRFRSMLAAVRRADFLVAAYEPREQRKTMPSDEAVIDRFLDEDGRSKPLGPGTKLTRSALKELVEVARTAVNEENLW